MLGKLFPPRCVVTGKKQLKMVPLLGQFMWLSGAFFLDRSNRQKSIDTLNNALTKLKKTKGGLFIFPEGTRSYSATPTLLPIKKGAFHLAVQGQIPIIPCVVSNTSPLYSLKLKNFNRGTIHIKVLDPISTVGMTKEDVPKLTAEVEKKMQAAIQELGYSEVSGEPKKQISLSSTETSANVEEQNNETTSLLSGEAVKK
ncbi:unnamed protein product [Ambrosiozyma monospora]|uniref:Unnamed protein product n=1 Tax=Ambrosiozyma monospora TaxID=43982 RepID=A0ACB5T4W0_AMBMO|nr:unnamed protein product [Ambrosiozyma monospora]